MSYKNDAEAAGSVPTPSGVQQALYLDSTAGVWKSKKSDTTTVNVGGNQPTGLVELEGTVYVDRTNSQGWAGADAGAWINSAFAYLIATYGTAFSGPPAGYTGVGAVQLGPGVFTYTTPIVMADQWFSISLRGLGEGLSLTPAGSAGKGGTVLNYTPTTGAALTIAGASSNNGGVAVEHLSLFGGTVGSVAVVPGGTATGLQWGLTGGSPPPGSSTAGATIKNVSIAQFATGENWNASGSIAYAVNHFNCKTQYCATGAIPFGEANNWFGGLIANNTTGVAFSNGGTDAAFEGVAFDDNTTTAINVSNSGARISLLGCRFENAGGGTDTYITQSAGSVTMLGGALQTDTTSGTSTGFVQQSGGVSTYVSVWLHAPAGRTVTQVFNVTGTTSVCNVRTPIISPAAGAGVISTLLPAAYSKRIVAGVAVTANQQVFSLPLPANQSYIGQSFRVRVSGTENATAAATVTYQVHIGTSNTTADAVVATAACSAATTGGSRFEGEVTIRTLGAAGTAMGQGVALGTNIVTSSGTATTTVNTTATNFLSVSVASNIGTHTVQTAIIEPIDT